MRNAGYLTDTVFTVATRFWQVFIFELHCGGVHIVRMEDGSNVSKQLRLVRALHVSAHMTCANDHIVH